MDQTAIRQAIVDLKINATKFGEATPRSRGEMVALAAMDASHQHVMDLLDAAFGSIVQLKHVKIRHRYAPRILAALLTQPHQGNDDRLVARAVSLSDALAHAILTQPVA